MESRAKSAKTPLQALFSCYEALYKLDENEGADTDKAKLAFEEFELLRSNLKTLVSIGDKAKAKLASIKSLFAARTKEKEIQHPVLVTYANYLNQIDLSDPSLNLGDLFDDLKNICLLAASQQLEEFKKNIDKVNIDEFNSVVHFLKLLDKNSKLLTISAQTNIYDRTKALDKAYSLCEKLRSPEVYNYDKEKSAHLRHINLMHDLRIILASNMKYLPAHTKESNKRIDGIRAKLLAFKENYADLLREADIALLNKLLGLSNSNFESEIQYHHTQLCNLIEHTKPAFDEKENDFDLMDATRDAIANLDIAYDYDQATNHFFANERYFSIPSSMLPKDLTSPTYHSLLQVINPLLKSLPNYYSHIGLIFNNLLLFCREGRENNQLTPNEMITWAIMIYYSKKCLENMSKYVYVPQEYLEFVNSQNLECQKQLTYLKIHNNTIKEHGMSEYYKNNNNIKALRDLLSTMSGIPGAAEVKIASIANTRYTWHIESEIASINKSLNGKNKMDDTTETKLLFRKNVLLHRLATLNSRAIKTPVKKQLPANDSNEEIADINDFIASSEVLNSVNPKVNPEDSDETMSLDNFAPDRRKQAVKTFYCYDEIRLLMQELEKQISSKIANPDQRPSDELYQKYRLCLLQSEYLYDKNYKEEKEDSSITIQQMHATLKNKKAQFEARHKTMRTYAEFLDTLKFFDIMIEDFKNKIIDQSNVYKDELYTSGEYNQIIYNIYNTYITLSEYITYGISLNAEQLETLDNCKALLAQCSKSLLENKKYPLSFEAKNKVLIHLTRLVTSEIEDTRKESEVKIADLMQQRSDEDSLRTKLKNLNKKYSDTLITYSEEKTNYEKQYSTLHLSNSILTALQPTIYELVQYHEDYLARSKSPSDKNASTPGPNFSSVNITAVVRDLKKELPALEAYCNSSNNEKLRNYVELIKNVEIVDDKVMIKGNDGFEPLDHNKLLELTKQAYSIISKENHYLPANHESFQPTQYQIVYRQIMKLKTLVNEEIKFCHQLQENHPNLVSKLMPDLEVMLEICDDVSNKQTRDTKQLSKALGYLSETYDTFKNAKANISWTDKIHLKVSNRKQWGLFEKNAKVLDREMKALNHPVAPKKPSP